MIFCIRALENGLSLIVMLICITSITALQAQWGVEHGSDGECWVNLPAGTDLSGYDVGVTGILCRDYNGPCLGLENACIEMESDKRYGKIGYRAKKVLPTPSGNSSATPLSNKTTATDSAHTITKSAAHEGQIFFASFPPFAEIFIDKQYIGKCNDNTLRIEPGLHDFRFVKGVNEFSISLEIKPGKNASRAVNITKQRINPE